jgi:hypothetical protein
MGARSWPALLGPNATAAEMAAYLASCRQRMRMDVLFRGVPLLFGAFLIIVLALCCLVTGVFAQSAPAAASTSLDPNAVVVALLFTIAWLIFSALGIVALFLAKITAKHP